MASSEFVFKLNELIVEERADYKRLENFVARLPPYLRDDPEGEPLYDEDGQRMTSVKLIDIKGLLASDTPEKLTAFWQRMTSVVETLRQFRAARNKRAASNTIVVSSGLGTSSRQLSPAPSFDTDR
ncbi:hypothetical protein L195_g026184, partial [Trifolium pratense]